VSGAREVATEGAGRASLPLSDPELERCMRAALSEADAAGESGELPIGAVVVIGGEIVSRGRARQRERGTQLAHAELDALLAGGEALLRRHDEAVVLSTVEPCPMCLGAIVMADVPHVVFAAHDARAGVPQVVTDVPYVRSHIATYRGGVLAADSLALVERYDRRLLELLRPTRG
jgi:tRNA(Arg) A34 adenosine deaminase TadA